MSESKPLASLTPSLLARKGSARPAMRPQGFAFAQKTFDPAADDLGWNDLGHDVAPHAPEPEATLAPEPVAAPEPLVEHAPEPVSEQVSAEVVAFPSASGSAGVSGIAPEVVRQLARLSESVVSAPVQATHSIARAAQGVRNKAAFTLRLDPVRHLKLRLLSAYSHRSAQQIVTAALDAALANETSLIDQTTDISSKGVSK